MKLFVLHQWDCLQLHVTQFHPFRGMEVTTIWQASISLRKWTTNNIRFSSYSHAYICNYFPCHVIRTALFVYPRKFWPLMIFADPTIMIQSLQYTVLGYFDWSYNVTSDSIQPEKDVPREISLPKPKTLARIHSLRRNIKIATTTSTQHHILYMRIQRPVLHSDTTYPDTTPTWKWSVTFLKVDLVDDA